MIKISPSQGIEGDYVMGTVLKYYALYLAPSVW